LRINGQATGDPKNESFTEAKILTQVAQRSFIGVDAQGYVTIGTTSASVAQLKNIVSEMGLVSAMCLDGGASSGLYYNGSYITNPGRNISNSINFLYQ
ncbi:MAG: phosphodiester glycosidase family protein, partial [Cellulosilyticum sp.]|nr:phosphodiester glycosidase family protein [Cellulosilyticum sp.]